MKTISCLCFFPFVFVFVSYAGTITGSIEDSTNASTIGNADVILECMSAVWNDSTKTDTSGFYQFVSVPVGTFKITARKQGYYSRYVVFVWANRDTSINILLPPLPSGTTHTGPQSGTWLASENPHRIIGNIQVDGNLYIAPGCSVLSTSAYNISIAGNLIIGSNNNTKAFCDKVKFWGPDAVPNNARLAISNCILNSCRIDEGGFRTLSCDSVLFIGDSTNIYFPAYDTFRILNSQFSSHSTIYIAASNTSIYRTDFSTIGGVAVDDNLNKTSFITEYSNYNSLSIGWGNSADVEVNINHCNIRVFGYEKPLTWPTRISNSIIDQAYLCPTVPYHCNTVIYTSFLDHNIIADTAVCPIFGFLIYNQVNNNGDTCDSWFNMRTNPFFADSARFSLSDISPAIAAASDGTNIGCYQGIGVSVQRAFHSSHQFSCNSFLVQKSRSRVTIKLKNMEELKPFKLSVYASQGRVTYSQMVAGGSNFIIWDTRKVSPGLYIIEVILDGHSSRLPYLLW